MRNKSDTISVPQFSLLARVLRWFARMASGHGRSDLIAELKMGLERLNRSQRAGHIGNWDYRPDTGSLWFSEEMYRLFGVEPGSEAATLDLVMTLCHPDDRQAMTDAIQRANETGDDYDFQHRLIRRDGTELVLHERGASIAGGPGEGKRFLGTTQDVTERVRADAALADARDTLEQRVAERTEELQTTLETLVEGVITIDGRGTVEAFSRSAETLFGYRADEVIGRNIKMLMSGDTSREHDGYLGRYMETGRAGIIGIGREVTGQRKDGSTFPLRLAVGEMEVGGQRKFVGTVYDITEHKRAEVELLAAKEQAEAASAAKSEFLSSMSHELRTPMNAVLGFAQLLQDNPEAPLLGDQELFVDEILQAGERMMGLVDDVLHLNELDTSRAAAETEECLPKQLIDTCIDVIAAEARQRGITIENALICDGSVHIRVVPRYFTRALLILLSNAVKYNRPNGKVTVGCRTDGKGRLRIEVADTGEGLTEEQRDKVFEPFERLGASASSTAGAGIGLTVARRLVESMGGKVDYKSPPGEGCTFWIDIPLAEPESV